MGLASVADYLDPELDSSGPGSHKPSSRLQNNPDELPLGTAMDNPEYFDGLVPTGGGIPQVGKPLPPDPRTNLNNNIEAMDPLLGKTGKEAAATANSAAPRLQKLGGHSNEAADSYINTDYPDHLGNHTGAQTPLAYMNPRSESAV